MAAALERGSGAVRCGVSSGTGKRVAVIRAVGVVFAESGPVEEKEKVREWLLALLQDSSEKVRRYAAAAIPKIGAGAKEEGRLLSALRTATGEREKKFLARTLGKIGGPAALEQGLLGEAEQKSKPASPAGGVRARFELMAF